MKAYISGPMSGLPQYNASAFEAAARKLREEGFEVISPVEMDKADGFSVNDNLSKSYWLFLSRDILTIGEQNLDVIFVLPDWQQSKGARLEVFLGLLLRLPICDINTMKTIPRSVVINVLKESLI